MQSRDQAVFSQGEVLRIWTGDIVKQWKELLNQTKRSSVEEAES